MNYLLCRTLICLCVIIAASPAFGEPARSGDTASHASSGELSLAQAFRDPPASARPRVWWHWMNGNVTKEGIAKDLAWMKRVGIGGLQNFDAGLSTPQVVQKRLVYMTPEWKEAFRFAAVESERLGLELTIAASPGWSETGGPWVEAKDGLKKVVWSELSLRGGKRFVGRLPAPPSKTGSFLDTGVDDPLASLTGEHGFEPPEYYEDIAVFAVPDLATAAPLPVMTAPDGTVLDAAALTDASLLSGVTLARAVGDAPTILSARYSSRQTIRSATLFIPGAKGMFTGPTVEPILEASNDGKAWRRIAPFPITGAPSTISFAPVTARHFRVVLVPLPFRITNQGDPAPGIEENAGFVAMMEAAAKAPFIIKHFSLSTAARIDQFESKAGFAIARDYDALGNPDSEAVGVRPERVINLTSMVKADGTLDWTAPKGNWRIIRLGSSLLGTSNHPAAPEATGLEVDKFDADAVRRYLDHYIGMYRDAVGPDLIGKRGVCAILTDSIEVGAANWTPKMVEQFERLRGYDPRPWLPTLMGTLVGTRAQSDAFLRDYRQTLADLMASAHYGTVATVARANGLKVYGEALEDNRPSLGDDMAMRRYADVPMAALWTFSRAGGPNPSFVADMKGAASVAHVYGQNLVAAESMTSALAPWAYAPNELRRIIDLEFATGINRPVIHTSVHQPVEDKVPGLSLMIFGQFFNRHEAWADLARPWIDYIARSSVLLQAGRNVADVAYFYGEEGPLTGLYGQKGVADAPKNYAYDFVNRDALFDALSVQDGTLVTKGGARYRVLYLGGSTRRMTVPTLRRLADLVEGGAIVVGLAPVDSPSLRDDPSEFAALVAKLWGDTGTTQLGKGKVIARRDIDGVLADLGVLPAFRANGASQNSEILFVQRQTESGSLWFLNNRRQTEERFDARFPITGKRPTLWHADTGRMEPVSYRIENGETIVPMTLAGEDSVFVVFDKPAAALAMTVKSKSPRRVAVIDGAWSVRFQPGRGAPDAIKLGKLQSLSDHTDTRVKYFSGIATYSRSFVLPKGVKAGQPLWLDLGAVGEIAQVSVNGKDVGYAWHKPYRVDIGSAVKKGTNTISVRVGNLWVNRLIGDAQPGADKLTWTAIPTYRADAPLRPSGLMGPVTLEASSPH